MNKIFFTSIFLLTLATSCVYVRDVQKNGSPPVTDPNATMENRLNTIDDEFSRNWLAKRGIKLDEVKGMRQEDVRAKLGPPHNIWKEDGGRETWRYIVPHYFFLTGHNSILLKMENGEVKKVE